MPRLKKVYRLRKDYITREVWGHNAHLGRVRMAQIAMSVIRRSPQATEQARRRAHLILAELEALHVDLQTRVDPPSAFQVETKTSI